MKGVIKFISEEGYGFIICEDKSEIYFHYTNFEDQEEAKSIKADDEVEFEIGHNKKGNKAINIKKIEKEKEG